jgi:hypothetical protein
MSSDTAAGERAPVTHSRNFVFFVVALFPLAFSVAGLLIDAPAEIFRRLVRILPIGVWWLVVVTVLVPLYWKFFVSGVFLATTITTRPLMRTPTIAE